MDLFLKNLKYIYNTLGKKIFLLGGKFGYIYGGTVTQATSKATAFTLDAVTGRIILNNSALAAWTASSAAWTNSFLGSYDTIQINQDSGARGAYTITVDAANGSGTLWIFNNSSTSLSEAVAFRFTLLHGSQS